MPEERKTITARAPGRLEFIGNHTDYNGGWVMGVAVEQGVTVQVNPRADNTICLSSQPTPVVIQSELEDIHPLSGEELWGNYVLGVIKQIQDQIKPLEHGFELKVSSNLPSGAGMSSSAALELAAAYALSGLFGIQLEPVQWARLCRKAENDFVGVPVGILDQGVSAFGKKDHLVKINCKIN